VNLQESGVYECVQERSGRWHIVAGHADEGATWRPIMCGEGIVFPGNSQMRPAADIYDGCVMRAVAVRRRDD
jgi:hypothetical protein